MRVGCGSKEAARSFSGDPSAVEVVTLVVTFYVEANIDVTLEVLPTTVPNKVDGGRTSSVNEPQMLNKCSMSIGVGGFVPLCGHAMCACVRPSKVPR